jgi:hypothetical protein
MKTRKAAQAAFLFLALALTGACNQDPIFHSISQEVKPAQPRIKGGPTNMVVFERYQTEPQPILYVASGTSLYWYAKARSQTGNPGWDRSEHRIDNPGGQIKQLAATSRYLYAITGEGLFKIGKEGAAWTQVSTDTSFQTIYAADDKVFVCFESGSDGTTKRYTTKYIDETGSNTLESLPGLSNVDKCLLTGAVFDGTDVYLATEAGIWRKQPGVNPARIGAADLQFVGIINLKSEAAPYIVAMSRNGKLYRVSSSLTQLSQQVSNYATGALALWRNPGVNDRPVQILLAGRQDSLTTSTTSGYTYGFQELPLISWNGTGPSSSFRVPGSYPTSTADSDRYTSTIGKHPVNHLLQTPYEIDSGMTLFASTETGGLWSYRSRSGTPQWNAEE